MNGLFQDVRYALRGFRRSPGFAAVAVATLALGIGAATATFSAVDSLLFAPLPFPRADRLVFGVALREGFDPFGTSLLEYAAYRSRSGSLESCGVGARRSFHLSEGGEPERLQGAEVMASYLDTAGVQPLLGRRFAAGEDGPGGAAVALLGYGLWQRRFGADHNVVGKSIQLDGRAHTVVGVLPRGFDMPYGAEVWVPLPFHLPALTLSEQAVHGYELIGRLKAGVPREKADSELKAIAHQLEQEYPEIRRGWSYTLVSLRQQLLGDLHGRTRHSLVTIALAVGFLLLICCANVANLLLARGVSREGEMAIRLSLGGARRRLLRQLLTESLLLAVLGGAAGILLAYWILPVLAALNPIRAVSLGDLLKDFRIDRRALATSLAVTFATGVAFGILPALRFTRSRDLSTRLKQRQPGRAASADRRPLAALVIGEIAVSVALLVAGGLMIQSFHRLQAIDLGFRTEKVLTMQLALPRKYAEQASRVRLTEQILERVRAIPGVATAGFTTNLPLDPLSLDSVFFVEGRPPSNPADVPITAHRLVTPGYLETLGVTLTRGRWLEERDNADSVRVAVVSEELVRQAWPGQDPIGKRIRREVSGRTDTPWMTVVGVVRDTKEDRFNFRIDRAVWYLPYSQQSIPLPVDLPLSLAVATSGDPTSVAASVRAAIRLVDPAQPVSRVVTMKEHLSDLLLTERFSAVLMSALAGFGLLLAALGLYGVLAFSVRQRRGEIGLRMALGAGPADIRKLVLGGGALLIAAGVGTGLVGARALAQMLSGSLYHVSPTDLPTFAAVVLLLSCVALAACYLPARRAARVHPVIALRND